VVVNGPTGVYRITFSKRGFTHHKVNAQVVVAGTRLTINAMLEVGSTSTTV